MKYINYLKDYVKENHRRDIYDFKTLPFNWYYSKKQLHERFKSFLKFIYDSYDFKFYVLNKELNKIILSIKEKFLK